MEETAKVKKECKAIYCRERPEQNKRSSITNIKHQIYIKENVPLPPSGGNLPEIFPIHQLRDIHAMVRKLQQVYLMNYFR